MTIPDQHVLVYLLGQLDDVRNALIRNADDAMAGDVRDAARAAIYAQEARLWRMVAAVPRARWDDVPAGARATLAQRAAHRAGQCAEQSEARWVR